ncbi:VWA domain-containing protein [Nocardioides sp. zg-579]|uniref:VWA domain-containing protein n=1 Tax=Nocardioides marmotae TaxID=2663857 RepID=A0A6I3JDV5_9ACTN|nr:VWA domain-containing protein [Nocardioides marmotae]MCR6032575.1 VWA domain-containing protein [Gordonia jinghuaiqii]MTB96223.1 VWA domain-containing protein [Nocardioides marmotae]QKD99707.1 VWA domain-containing protein [Nocardioides marmotae]
MGTTARSLPALLALVAVLLTPAPATTAAAAPATAPAAAPAPANALGAAEEDPGQLLLMLDASGSMKEPDPSGTTKMVAAKRALTSVVDTLPEDSTVGLRVYGDRSDSCRDSRLVAPLATLDRDALRAAINQTQPTGETPIAHSLREAVKDLGPEGRRTIVLVSDGEETCAPNPCQAVRALVGSGIDLRIDTVGFGVGAPARDQLQCIADAGGGTYYDAADAEALTASLAKLSQRATRPFTVTGEPVEATIRPEEGPLLEPGQYTDRFVVGSPLRYYRLARTPGSTVRFSVTARPLATAGTLDVEDLDVTVTTPAGETCESERESRFDPLGLGQVLVLHLRVDGATPEELAAASAAADPSPTESASESASGSASDPASTPTEEPVEPAEPCATSEELVVAVSRTQGEKRPAPVEVVYVEEPVVTDLADLPAQLDGAPGEPTPAPAQGDGTPVVGGGGFSDAPVLEDGTYRETLLPGEQVFYRVPVDWGQSATVTVDLPAPGEVVRLSSTSYINVQADLFTPDRLRFTNLKSIASLSDSTMSSQATRVIPEVRYRNREAVPTNDPGWSWADLQASTFAGDHYLALSREQAEPGTDEAQPVTVRFRVAVTGEPAGAPTYDGTDPTAEESADAEDAAGDGSADGAGDTEAAAATGGSALPWVLGAGVLVLVLGAVVTVVVRRRA